MSEQPADPLAHLDHFSVTCDMQHPDRPGALASPCHREAAWIVTHHDCRKKRATNPGTSVPICAQYLEYLKQLTFPYRCPGCAQEITSLVQLIWDVQKFDQTPAK